MKDHISVRLRAAALLASLSLLLTACFVTPGKFTSELVLEKNGQFSFTYNGELHFLALSDLGAAAGGEQEFQPEPCWDEASLEGRDCSEDELAEQKARWDAGAQQRAANAEIEAQQFATLMGGIDPTDPEAAAELEQLLLRQRGWNSVTHKGDGLFAVDYSIAGSLGHDFTFPFLEGFPPNIVFVQAILRDDDMVRINAPGYSAQDESNPLTGMLAGFSGLSTLGQLGESDEENAGVVDGPPIPQMDGVFTIVTDGQILANNTDEGPQTSPRGQILTWEISPRTSAAPTALINLSE
ncbi:MAG: hypothetical protein ABJP48_02755 [Erythrobacter sp.]